jgi:hypothetical protein
VVAIDQAARKEHVLPDDLRLFNNKHLAALSVAASRKTNRDMSNESSGISRRTAESEKRVEG